MGYISNDSIPTQTLNVTPLFREQFSTFDTTNTWDLTTGSGDIVQLDGNIGAISYLVISKDPLTVGTETSITTKSAFSGPFELTTGMSMSNRVWGQECAIDIISTDTPLSPVADIAIASISQITTTVSIVTATPHGLSTGSRFLVYGVSDSRLNYPELIVSNITSPTSFVATASAQGTITSLTSGTLTSQGFVKYRPPLGYAQEGTSLIFENTNATQASSYTRAGYGEAYMSGTFAGNHSIVVGSTSSIQSSSAGYTYSFTPTTEYRFLLQNDKLHIYDVGIDSTAQPSARLNRTNIVPSLNKNYKLRFRVNNNRSLSVPTAKIVSATKAGSTTATIVTDTPHGLTTSDFVVIYGNRDQTNFANLTSSTQVASIVNSTTFTIAYGVSATATTYGGMVSRIQGGNVVPTSYNTITIQSATVAGGELTLVGNTTWAWLVGDYINVYGCRNNVNGGDMGIDGTYKVANVSNTTLLLIPIGTTTLPAPFASTNCGGTTIRRTDVRIATARIFEYLRERVEVIGKGDAASGVPIVANGGTIGTIGSIGTVSNAFIATNQLVADISSAAITSTATHATLIPGSGTFSHEVNVMVTAVSGTNPTMDVVVQESDDGGTNWYDVYHFPRIIAAGQYRSPAIPLTGNRIRYVRTIAGTTPSFTMSLNRIQIPYQTPIQRQFVDRVMDPNTLNSTTTSYFTEGSVDLNIFVSMGAVTTTAPTLVLEISPDNTTWVQVGADITTAANTISLLQAQNAQARFSRLRVKSAGTGATLSYTMFKGVGR